MFNGMMSVFVSIGFLCIPFIIYYVKRKTLNQTDREYFMIFLVICLIAIAFNIFSIYNHIHNYMNGIIVPSNRP